MSLSNAKIIKDNDLYKNWYMFDLLLQISITPFFSVIGICCCDKTVHVYKSYKYYFCNKTHCFIANKCHEKRLWLEDLYKISSLLEFWLDKISILISYEANVYISRTQLLYFFKKNIVFFIYKSELSRYIIVFYLYYLFNILFASYIFS